jgi:Golgi phosphoprotein 3 (GPP34)
LPGELKPLTGTIAAPLVDRGVLTEQRSKFLGLFPSTRFPEADPEPERALRFRLRAVLLGEREPATSEALLLALLVPLDLVGGLVDKDQRRAAKKRAKEIADGGIAGTAVSDAVREIQAAVMVAVIVPTVVAGSG